MAIRSETPSTVSTLHRGEAPEERDVRYPVSSNKRVPTDRRPTGTAFLLAQLGAHRARRFAERVAQIGLKT